MLLSSLYFFIAFVKIDASIFFAQLLFLEDPNFVSDINNGIDFHGMDVASSVKVTVEKYIEKFKASNDTQLMERCMDLMDIGLRIIQYLLDSKEYPRPNDDQRMIFVGDDVMPSDLMRVSTDNILGIACELVEKSELENITQKIVKELISVSPLAQRTIKSVLNATQNATLHTSIDLEGEAYGRLRSSNDFKEGVQSFSEKRPPSYKGN